MGYKHDFSGGTVDFIIPPPPSMVTAATAPVKAALEPGSPQEQVKIAVRQMAYVQVYDVKVFRCTCQRCPKIWITLQQTRPKTCPNCKSPWWDERPSGKMGPVLTQRGMVKKKGKGKKSKATVTRILKPGWVGRGRPPRDAYVYVGAEGETGGEVVVPEDIPEIPVALLGALDQPVPAFDQGDTGTAAADEEDFPVPTPFDSPASIPAAGEYDPNPPIPAGQPAHVGGRPGPASEVLPPPALDPDLDGPPTIDDDDWERFGE